MSATAVSIIICTRNRADDLAQTLDAMRHVHVPDGLSCELLVVDNGSTDLTARVVQSAMVPNIPIHYLMEPLSGKGFAYNTALHAARGTALLFTDDDVRPPTDWLQGMCGSILNGQADAVAGGVRPADALERPWMKPFHRKALASTEGIDPRNPKAMIGANMAFAKAVTDRVPAFDVELGPGALGFNDETLFSFQLQEAGYRLVSAFDIVNEHHFDPSRLLRVNFLDVARKAGRSSAYFAYHWEHKHVSNPWVQITKSLVRLAQWRLTRRSEITLEGIPEWEFGLIWTLSFCRQYLHERKRPRNYDLRGLVKRQS